MGQEVPQDQAGLAGGVIDPLGSGPGCRHPAPSSAGHPKDLQQKSALLHGNSTVPVYGEVDRRSEPTDSRALPLKRGGRQTA